ncbi:MAG: cardiolipin synthase ClsB [Rhodocyclales bacterium GT-UBC]|nr:MAG: cardiolipin synthase ClsB [Rhodocyclales bacterium GT-UBC]
MNAGFESGNSLTLLNSGAAYFPAMLAEIDAASAEIYLESYIFANDTIGRRVVAALCAAAQRGVRVHVIVDGFGGRNFVEDFMPQLAQAEVQAMLYRPEIGRFRLKRHRLRRLHRKLVVIDGRVAFVGGINIIDDHNAPPDMSPRYDYAVRIEGPTVAQIHHAVRRMWEIVTWVNFKRRFRLPPYNRQALPAVGSQRAAFLIRDNIRHRQDILNAYIGAINLARDEILIANAYFMPGVRFARALQAAARRGVRISILLQGKTDHPLLRFATQTLYLAAMENNIRIFEYEKSFMHAKVAVIDGQWATIGSSNIDPFSLLLAKEANLVVDDRRLACELHESIETAIREGAREILAETLIRLPLYTKLLRWLSYGLVRLLVGLTGYGPKHWRADEEQIETSGTKNEP